MTKEKTNIEQGEAEMKGREMMDVVRNLAEKARRVTTEAEELIRQMKLARGTRDSAGAGTRDNAGVAGASNARPLVVRGKPAQILPQPKPVPPPAPVPAMIRSPSDAYVGDDGPTAELMAKVRDLISERPLLLQDLIYATGARPNRLKGVLMRLQREEGATLVNLGTETRALWFMPDEETLKRIRKAVK